MTAPSPADMADCKGVLVRVHVSGVGCYSTERTTLHHAKQIVDRFLADLYTALQPGNPPIVRFPAGGARIEAIVAAARFASLEIVRVNAHGVAP